MKFGNPTSYSLVVFGEQTTKHFLVLDIDGQNIFFYRIRLTSYNKCFQVAIFLILNACLLKQIQYR